MPLCGIQRIRLDVISCLINSVTSVDEKNSCSVGNSEDNPNTHGYELVLYGYLSFTPCCLFMMAE